VAGKWGPGGVGARAFLQVVRGIHIAAPRDAARLREEFAEAIAINDAPSVVRFPKGSVGEDIVAVRRTVDGVDVLREAPHKDVLLVAIGPFARMALDVAERLAQQGIGATVIDPRWVVPVPQSVIELSRDHRLVITMEDGVRVAGIGTRVRQDLRSAGVDTAVDELGLPDEFIEHATREEILEQAGLSAAAIARDVIAQVLGSRIPSARPLDESSQPRTEAKRTK